MTNQDSAMVVGKPADRLRRKSAQADRYTSPWSLRERFGMLAWRIVECLLMRPTPKALNSWRLFLLRIFGCTVRGHPFVHPACLIKIPWQLTIEDRAAIGPHVEIYNLGEVLLQERCVVGQHSYLCGGSHDLSDPELPLIIGPIVIGPEAFIGARVLILPGVLIGPGAVIGAGSVVSRDMPPWQVCVGNPCKPLKSRNWLRS